jgi:hypothetical protein
MLGDTQLPVTLAQGDLTSFSGLCADTHTHTQVKINLLKKNAESFGLKNTRDINVNTTYITNCMATFQAVISKPPSGKGKPPHMVSHRHFHSSYCSFKVSLDSQATVEHIHSTEQDPYLTKAEFHTLSIRICFAKPQG